MTTNKIDLEVEQIKSGITTFIFSWMIHLNHKGLDTASSNAEVLAWVRDLCATIDDQFEKEQELSNQANTSV